MIRNKVNYIKFRQWLDRNKVTYLDLQAVARKLSDSNISNKTIGKKINEGEPLETEAILAWKKAYGMTQDEVALFFLNGEIQEVRKLEEYSDREILQEIARRATCS